MAAASTHPLTPIDPRQARSEFRDAILAAGLILRGDPVMDGKIHRVPVDGSRNKGNPAGWYVGYLDEYPAGKIGNFKEGTEIFWKANRPTRQLSAVERQARQARIEREQQQREAERVTVQNRVARWSSRTWEKAQEVAEHPYLTKKGVASYGLRIDGRNRLLIPMRDSNGVIQSLQSIGVEGNKHFTKGGRQIGMHSLIGALDPKKPLVFAEGYATAATIHEATGWPVVICFNSGNLLPVVHSFRHQYPEQRLVLAADNDHHLPEQGKPNVGLEKANKAAQTVHAAAVLLPEFPTGHPGTDWNDYYAQHGIEAVRTHFAAVLTNDRTVEAPNRKDRAVIDDMTLEEARANAIDIANNLPGGSEQNQILVSQIYDQLREQHPEMPVTETWLQAAQELTNRLDPLAQQAEQKLPVPENSPEELNRLDQQQERETEAQQAVPVPTPLAERLAELRQEEARLSQEYAWQEGDRKDREPLGKQLDAVQAEITRGSRMQQQKTPEPTPARARPAQERLTRQQVEQAIQRGGDLQDKDLSGLDLSNLTFRHMNLSGSSFANVTARNVRIEDCFALGTDFSQAQFDDSRIERLNASGSCWKQTELHHTPVTDLVLDGGMVQDLVISAESRTRRSGRTEQQQQQPGSSTWGQARAVAGQLLQNLTQPTSVRQELQTLWQTLGQKMQNWKDSVPVARPITQEEWRQSLAGPATPEATPREASRVMFSHVSFRNADLTGARFVGVSFHECNFDGAILRNVQGLSLEPDVTKVLERDTKRSRDLANLREEGLSRLGCKDQNANPERVAKLTESLDRQLSAGMEQDGQLTPRQILDNALKGVLKEHAVPAAQEQEQERTHTRNRPRTSRGR